MKNIKNPDIHSAGPAKDGIESFLVTNIIARR
jgi:hypothetical protein